MEPLELIEAYLKTDYCLQIPETASFYVLSNCDNTQTVKMYERGTEQPIVKFKWNIKTYKQNLKKVNSKMLCMSVDSKAHAWNVENYN